MIKIGLLIVAAFVIVYLVNKYNLINRNKENFNNAEDNEEYEIQPSDNSDSNFASTESTEQKLNNNPVDSFPKDTLTAEDLLPIEDPQNKWSQVTPGNNGSISDKNFLDAGYHTGKYGQSLRNANLQLRSEPPNPQSKVSPWLQSTIEPDINRKPLEIGN